MNIRPSTKVSEALRQCQSITLFGTPTDIYKVVFWNHRKCPFMIELKGSLNGGDFGKPDPSWFKTIQSMPLAQTLDRAAARKQLLACSYINGYRPNEAVYNYVLSLLAGN